jgi:general secretion pathway protein G
VKKENRRRNRQAGVTLIEMLVVVVIITLFASYVGMRLWPQADKARVTAAKAQIGSFMSALDTYKMDVGSFPTTEQGLAALRTRPAGAPQWSGPYLAKDIPMDPWGRPYLYRFPGQHSEDPEVICLGADGQPGGEGINADIVSWQ